MNKQDKILTDPVRIRQILGNLIDNVFKFTDNGVVELGCIFAKTQDTQYIRFYVKDSEIEI
jgi:signal transduction histidine kinase